MSFCSKCGTKVPEDVKFCSNCGNTLQIVPTASSGNAQVEQTENLSLWGYYVKALKNYVNFKGRARRKEYWGFYLFYIVIMVAISFVPGDIDIEKFFGTTSSYNPIYRDLYLSTRDERFNPYRNNSVPKSSLIILLYSMALCIPSLAVLTRRLHDVGKSGWSMLLVLIPIVGWILLWVWVCTDSDPNENEYGSNPKKTQSS